MQGAHGSTPGNGERVVGSAFAPRRCAAGARSRCRRSRATRPPCRLMTAPSRGGGIPATGTGRRVSWSSGGGRDCGGARPPDPAGDARGRAAGWTTTWIVGLSGMFPPRVRTLAVERPSGAALVVVCGRRALPSPVRRPGCSGRLECRAREMNRMGSQDGWIATLSRHGGRARRHRSASRWNRSRPGWGGIKNTTWISPPTDRPGGRSVREHGRSTAGS